MLSSEELENAQFSPNLEWSQTCRTCLQSGETRSLFERKNETPFSYADKVMLCTNMIIHEHDSLPDRICVPCVEELEVAYRFRINCDSSNAILQSYVVCNEEKSNETAPLALESEPEVVETTEEIAIPLDSGVLYTYKPPSGLNVKLVQCRTENGNGSPVPITHWREDVHLDEENVQVATSADADCGPTDDELSVSFPVPSNEDSVKVETIDAEGYSDDVLSASESESQSMVMDDDLLTKCCLPNGDIKIERLEESDTELYVYERVIDSVNEAMGTKMPDLMQSIAEPLDGINSSENISLDGISDSLVPLTSKSVRTLQTIRKTNTPNEVKPTIETVTTQPAADGSGIETVIRLKRNLSTSKQTHMCDICNTTYKHKNALETHLRRHRGDRPYKCEHCDKAFVVPFELRRHVRTHTGHKPYKCQYCDRAYSDFGSRTKHERTHTGERPYMCEYCRKSFCYSHVLYSHLLTHTGEKKYSCSTCGKRFTKSHHLKGHLKTHLNASVKPREGKEAEKKKSSNKLENAVTATEGKTVEAKDSSVATIIMMSDQQSEQALVDSYVNSSRLTSTGWTLADVSLPLTDTGPDGASNMAGGSVVTIGAEELGNVSIVSFSDYMMKTESIERLMMDGAVESVAGNVGTVQSVHSHALVDTLQEFVTVLLPKSDSTSALVDGGFGNMEMIG